MKLLRAVLIGLPAAAAASEKHPQHQHRRQAAVSGPPVPENGDHNGQLAGLMIPVPLCRIAHIPVGPPAPQPERRRQLVQPFADLTVHRQAALRMAIDGSREDAVRWCLADAALDPGFNDNEAIRLACQLGGRHAIVKLLLAHRSVDPAACDNEALRVAAAQGDQLTVEALLESGRVEPGARESEALRTIIAAGPACHRLAIVKRLLAHPAVDPAAKDNEAVIAAARTGNAALLRLLLEDGRVDAGARGNEALLASVHHRNLEAFKELLRHPAVDPAARDCEALRLIVQERHRADFLRALLGHRRVKARADFAGLLGRALALTMASSSTRCASALVTLKHGDALMEAAVRAGTEAMATHLLADPRLDAMRLLGMAAAAGNAMVVKRCLWQASIRPGRAYARLMEEARGNGHEGIVRLLAEHRAKALGAPKEPLPSCPPAPCLALPHPSPLGGARCLPGPRERVTPCPPPASSQVLALPPMPVCNAGIVAPTTAVLPPPGMPAQQHNAPAMPAQQQQQQQQQHQTSLMAFQIPPANSESMARVPASAVERAPARSVKAMMVAPRRKAVSRKGARKQEAPEGVPAGSPLRPAQGSRKRKAADDNPARAAQPRHPRDPRAISVQERIDQGKRRRLHEAESASARQAPAVSMEVQPASAPFEYLVFAATEAAKDPADSK